MKRMSPTYPQSFGNGEGIETPKGALERAFHVLKGRVSQEPTQKGGFRLSRGDEQVQNAVNQKQSGADIQKIVCGEAFPLRFQAPDPPPHRKNMKDRDPMSQHVKEGQEGQCADVRKRQLTRLL